MTKQHILCLISIYGATKSTMPRQNGIWLATNKRLQKNNLSNLPTAKSARFASQNRTNFTRGVRFYFTIKTAPIWNCGYDLQKIMKKGELAIKKLDVRIFPNAEVITDLAGNTFLTRTAVARLFGCSLPTLATTYKRKGLRPLDRYVNGYKVYLLDDVERFYNRRAAY